MKKILFILLIVLVSCEKGETGNELVGTEWIYQSPTGMNEKKVQRPDGGYDIITYQSTHFSEIKFTTNGSGIRRIWSVGGGPENEWEYTYDFEYTYKNKRGDFITETESSTVFVHFELSEDMSRLYSNEWSDHKRK